MKIKRILASLLITSVITSSFPPIQNVAFAGETKSSQTIPVYIDGDLITFPDVQPAIINERTMVPLYTIATEMGAEVEWDDATKKITMYLYNRYVILYIDNPTMISGEFIVDEEENIVLTSTEMTVLDTPPIIQDGMERCYTFCIHNISNTSRS